MNWDLSRVLAEALMTKPPESGSQDGSSPTSGMPEIGDSAPATDEGGICFAPPIKLAIL